MDDSEDSDEDDEEEDDEMHLNNSLKLEAKHRTPVILPRARYAGARNVETVKDGV